MNTNTNMNMIRNASLGIAAILLAVALPAFGQPYYVAPAGNDANPGTIGKPFASLQRAQAALRQKRGTVYLREGTYYLPEPLIFTARDSGVKDAPVVFRPYQNEHAVLSGGVKLDNLVWEPWTNGIVQAKVPEDIFRRNIVWREYQPAIMSAPPWGQELDYNLVHQQAATNAPATRLQGQSGRDEHSIVANAQFVDPAQGDYRVKEGSPALSLGFVNFPMDRFGVQKPALRALARTPVLPGPM